MTPKTEEQLNTLIDELKQKLQASEERALKAEDNAKHFERQLKDDNLGWSLGREMEYSDLPLPRLQMHWERDDPRGYNTRCTYMLVYEHYLGIKKIAGHGDPAVVGVPFGQTKRNGREGSFVDRYDQEGKPHITVPHREWAHAISDAQQLKLPLYVTTCDGDVAVVDISPVPGKSLQRMLKLGGKPL